MKNDRNKVQQGVSEMMSQTLVVSLGVNTSSSATTASRVMVPTAKPCQSTCMHESGEGHSGVTKEVLTRTPAEAPVVVAR